MLVVFGGDSGGAIVNRWMRERLPRARRPLFLFVNYMECHWSYAPPPAYVRKVGGPRYRFPTGMRYRAEMAARVGAWEAIAPAGERDLEVCPPTTTASSRTPTTTSTWSRFATTG